MNLPRYSRYVANSLKKSLKIIFFYYEIDLIVNLIWLNFDFDFVNVFYIIIYLPWKDRDYI